LNFDHWYLFEIWFLVLGIFIDFSKQFVLVISFNQLFNQLSLAIGTEIY